MDPATGAAPRIDRRRALLMLGGAGLGVMIPAACSSTGSSKASPGSAPSGAAGRAGACTLTPELTEGPYYLDLEKLRRDITEGRPGVPLTLRATVVDSKTCKPVPAAAVDVWHCDAGGVYSGFTSVGNGTGAGPDGGGPAGGGGRDDGTTFLRGVQVAGRDGVAEFRTIYPGWYQGRALHIHVKVHVGGSTSGATYRGGHVSHTGQLFFPEDVTAKVAKLTPYRYNDAELTHQSDDSIFQQGGRTSIVELSPQPGGGEPAKGYVATVTVAVDPDATPAVQ